MAPEQVVRQKPGKLSRIMQQTFLRSAWLRLLGRMLTAFRHASSTNGTEHVAQDDEMVQALVSGSI